MANGQTTDPLIGYQFRVEIDGPVEFTGFFAEVSGIGSENEVVEETVTDDQGNSVVRKLPGRLKWEDVVFKRGITDNMGIWDWRQKAEEGNMEEVRANCSIVMMSTNGEDVARWDLVNAWPSKVTGPAPKSDSNEIGVEEMTIVHEGMKRVS